MIGMMCIEKECKHREFNGGDEKGDFYFCKYIGISIDRGLGECLLDIFDQEINKILI